MSSPATTPPRASRRQQEKGVRRHYTENDDPNFQDEGSVQKEDEDEHRPQKKTKRSSKDKGKGKSKGVEKAKATRAKNIVNKVEEFKTGFRKLAGESATPGNNALIAVVDADNITSGGLHIATQSLQSGVAHDILPAIRSFTQRQEVIGILSSRDHELSPLGNALLRNDIIIPTASQTSAKQFITCTTNLLSKMTLTQLQILLSRQVRELLEHERTSCVEEDVTTTTTTGAPNQDQQTGGPSRDFTATLSVAEADAISRGLADVVLACR
jgi:hypothetical protein